MPPRRTKKDFIETWNSKPQMMWNEFLEAFHFFDLVKVKETSEQKHTVAFYGFDVSWDWRVKRSSSRRYVDKVHCTSVQFWKTLLEQFLIISEILKLCVGETYAYSYCLISENRPRESFGFVPTYTEFLTGYFPLFFINMKAIKIMKWKI